MKGLRTIFFLVYVLFALYFLNLGLTIVSIPEFLAGIEKWIFVLGGIMILFAGINHWKRRRINTL